jgi:site-specific DNA-methyltransferase (adenine-specific)
MCGSGTTCKVAQQMGRNFIGIDISPEYCEIARNRIEKVDGFQLQLPLDTIELNQNSIPSLPQLS